MPSHPFSPPARLLNTFSFTPLSSFPSLSFFTPSYFPMFPLSAVPTQSMTHIPTLELQVANPMPPPEEKRHKRRGKKGLFSQTGVRVASGFLGAHVHLLRKSGQVELSDVGADVEMLSTSFSCRYSSRIAFFF